MIHLSITESRRWHQKLQNLNKRFLWHSRLSRFPCTKTRLVTKKLILRKYSKDTNENEKKQIQTLLFRLK